MKKVSILASLFLLFYAAASAQIPSVKLRNTDGKIVNTAELGNDGRPFIISFFATWCKPCLRELTAVNEVYADWQEETGVRLIAVSIDQAQDANKVKPLMDGKGFEYEVLLDVNGDFKRAMGVNNIPHVFLFDGKGNKVYSHIGYKDGDETALYKEVKAAIK